MCSDGLSEVLTGPRTILRFPLPHSPFMYRRQRVPLLTFWEPFPCLVIALANPDMEMCHRGMLSVSSSITSTQEKRCMTHKFLLMLFFLLLSVETGLSQDNSWIITIATGDTLSGCSLISLEGDSLRIAWSGYPVSLPVESLRKLQYHRESEFWRGAFYGSVAGAIVGTVGGAAGASSESSAAAGGALGALTGFVVGGLTAEYISRDDRYDLQKYDLPEKKNIIRTLLPQSELRLGGEKPK